jgi:hypothetical protein
MSFAYLRDPLFLVSVAAYFFNRFAVKPLTDGSFFHAHLNDLICIPFWVPIMIYLQHRIGLRPISTPPLAHEIVIPLLIWSWTFELFLPQSGWLGESCVADYRDVIYYAAGATVAALFWRSYYAEKPPTSDILMSDDRPNSTLTKQPHETSRHSSRRLAYRTELK